jgi:3-hydroxybutyryl-CoA dehydrogenase
MRVLAMLINEAAFAVMEGLAAPADIDKAMMLGVNYPKGLLAWADEIGIGVVTLILDGLYREYQQERYRPCVQLKQMMRAGWTGKAAGRGFYTY